MKIGIRFGALAPQIATQLQEQNAVIDKKDLGHFQRDADAITRLNVRSLVTDGEARKARHRLIKRIIAAVA